MYHLRVSQIKFLHCLLIQTEKCNFFNVGPTNAGHLFDHLLWSIFFSQYYIQWLALYFDDHCTIYFVRHHKLKSRKLPSTGLQLGTIHSEWERAHSLTHSATAIGCQKCDLINKLSLGILKLWSKIFCRSTLFSNFRTYLWICPTVQNFLSWLALVRILTVWGFWFN